MDIGNSQKLLFSGRFYSVCKCHFNVEYNSNGSRLLLLFQNDLAYAKWFIIRMKIEQPYLTNRVSV